MNKDWDFVRFCMDMSDYRRAADELDRGEDFNCDPEHSTDLRPYLHSRGLDVIMYDGRAYIMTIEEASCAHEVNDLYGAAPLDELVTEPNGVFLEFDALPVEDAARADLDVEPTVVIKREVH